jgi:hypothetical protein
MMQRYTAEVLTSIVWVNSVIEVFQRYSRYWERDGFGGMAKSVGPAIPELAISTLMKPSFLVIVSTARDRSSFEVTSP